MIHKNTRCANIEFVGYYAVIPAQGFGRKASRTGCASLFFSAEKKGFVDGCI
jgi:hypothetical protein